jgi:hypothetical protein
MAQGDTGWRVEAVRLDRGTGLRSWFVVHGAGTVTYCATAGQVQAVLAAHHVKTSELQPPDEGLPAGEDGCE